MQRFESRHPSQAVRSRLGNCDRYDPAIGSLRSVDPKATTPNSQSANCQCLHRALIAAGIAAPAGGPTFKYVLPDICARL